MPIWSMLYRGHSRCPHGGDVSLSLYGSFTEMQECTQVLFEWRCDCEIWRRVFLNEACQGKITLQISSRQGGRYLDYFSM